MKTKILFILTLLFAAQPTKAQVLWSENFNNLVLGNVGADYTGATPGQGGWYTFTNVYNTTYTLGNNDFKIVVEPGRGNVLEIKGPGVSLGRSIIEQKSLETLWDNRILGNNVLKIEYDFFTGNSSITGNSFWAQLDFFNTNTMIRMYYYNNSNLIKVSCSSCIPQAFTDILPSGIVLKNTWIKLELYLDYANGISYFTVPSLGISGVSGWLSSSNLSEIKLVVETNGIPAIHKFDNFVVSAVDNVPLSTQDFISSKFKVFPNPANNIVNITNNENIGVEQLQVFDISGKAVQSQIFNNENQVQLNIENLEPGTYMLQIKTDKGMAVKKIVKK